MLIPGVKVRTGGLPMGPGCPAEFATTVDDRFYERFHVGASDSSER